MSDLVRNNQPGAIARAQDSNGDLSRLTEVERKIVYIEMCKAYDLNPLSFPLDYIKGDKGTLKIYLNSVGASQLRDRFEVSTRIKSRELLEDIWVVVVEAQRGNRTEEATGAASIFNKYGETSPTAKVNALKKAETQAKRRATLSICGFGWDDEESGKVLKAEFHDPPEDVIVRSACSSAESQGDTLTRSQLPPAIDNSEIWRTWKNPEDAIAWAKNELPGSNEQWLISEMRQLAPINGKKAPAWVKKINEIKELG
ncbi:hypothetical protein [Rivularia sp. UHCC 0363]|uniref:hypothetical protein n=1 Tax=Rivularia sp. UHCC 0363 TaxID=3110244 RepID=UPI002B1F51EA|nr:hypothetical protein [Rivularia sp. UHCC 0363]MEA5595688.1 hypothetical protein [Rivularia sp. UHCC 0363]